MICFDLEGPLAPQDTAYELMKLFPRGGKIFEVISRYDALLTLEVGLTMSQETPCSHHSFPCLSRNRRETNRCHGAEIRVNRMGN